MLSVKSLLLLLVVLAAVLTLVHSAATQEVSQTSHIALTSPIPS